MLSLWMSVILLRCYGDLMACEKDHPTGDMHEVSMYIRSTATQRSNKCLLANRRGYSQRRENMCQTIIGRVLVLNKIYHELLTSFKNWSGKVIFCSFWYNHCRVVLKAYLCMAVTHSHNLPIPNLAFTRLMEWRYSHLCSHYFQKHY